MSMTGLDPGECITVRRLLDPSLTSDDLPDEVIAEAAYLRLAWTSLVTSDPLAMTRDDSNGGPAVRLALLCTVAALIAPQLPVIVSERTQAEGYQYSRQPVDLLALAGRLRAQAAAHLAAVLQPDSLTPNRPTLFALASGRRGA